MKQYILFDLDGTISDPKVGITKSVQYALRASGILVDNPDDLCAFIGPPLMESFMNFYGFDIEATAFAISKYREYFSSRGIFENVLYQGIPHMLETLKRLGKTLILATSKPTVYAKQVLKYFNIHEMFSFISGSELNGTRSKKSEVIQYALDQNHISTLDSVVMVGDREHDIIGATQTGIQSIGVLYGFGNFEELSNAGATKIVETVDDLFSVLVEDKV